MILVLLGTQKHQFTRLLNLLEEGVISKQIPDQLVVQNGYTNFDSENMDLIGFVNESDLDVLISKADLIICHGGAGSLFKCLKYDKKIIAVARLASNAEHFNDHQLEIVDRLSQMGYILSYQDHLSMAQLIQQARTFNPKPFHSNTEFIIAKIRRFINEQA